MSRIAIVSDAWHPQTNGVVTRLVELEKGLQRRGHEVRMVTPDLQAAACWTFPFDRQVSMDFNKRRIYRELDAFQPEYIHIATEWFVGHWARKYCLKNGLPFTTAFHTNFDSYVAAWIERHFQSTAKKVLSPDAIGNSLEYVKEKTFERLRRFHEPSSAVMVATNSLRQQLESKGVERVVLWSCGVNPEQFRPYGKEFKPYADADIARPIWFLHSRISSEKNIGAFLDLELPGSKVVVGDGPILKTLRKKYPGVHFAGEQKGETLGRYIAAADIFVFPSKSETFGLVLIEALACGLPVVALPAPGPIDIFRDKSCNRFSRLNDNLGVGAREMFEMWKNGTIDSAAARTHALRYSLDQPIDQFYQNLQGSFIPNVPNSARRMGHVGRMKHLFRQGSLH